MRRLPRIDRALLLVLVPFWVVCQVLHVDRQLSDLPLTWFPVYLAPDGGEAGTPVVLRLWDDATILDDGVRPGDRLLAMAGRSLRGASRMEVLGHAPLAASPDRTVPFEVERGGERRAARLALRDVPVPLAHLPLSLALGISATLALLRGRGSRTARAYAVVALVYSIHFCSLYGGQPWQTTFGIALVIVTGALYPPLMLRAALLFPESTAPRTRLGLAWPWVLVVTGPALYAWILGIPSLGLFGFRYASLCFGAGIAGLLTIIAFNYRRADVRGRRQMKWGIYGFAVGTIPTLAASTAVAGAPEFRPVYEASLAFQALIPVFLFIAIVRDNLFDIDRLITTTAAYTLTAPVFMGLLFTVVPPAADWVSERLGLQPTTVLWVFVVAIVAPIPSAARAFRPVLERIFFREELRVESELRGLRAGLTAEEGTAAMLTQLGEGLGRVLEPETVAIYAQAGEAFVPVFADGTLVPPAFERRGALTALLADATGSVPRATLRQWARRLSDADRAALESLDADVILPVCRDDDLEAFVALGERRSGHLYGGRVLANLESLVERMTLVLEATEQRQLEADERALYEELARYAPGTLAEEIRRGVDVAPGEREVSVLFVDVRGYTSFSQGRAAPEIFAVVNAYTEAVSRVVREHGGAVVEFHGDGLMAAFGALTDDAGKEAAAVAAGRAILKEATRAAASAGEAALSVGVGVATGPAFVGDIQSVDRKIWSVIGNTTNVAARLEALTRDLDVAMIVDDETHAAAAEAAADFQRHDGVRLKGRDDVITVWTLALASARPLSPGV